MSGMHGDSWQPSAPLASAVITAISTLARQWPRAMALALDSSDAGRAFMADYAFAMKGADLRAIPIAAREWIGENNMPPRPADLGKLAREITRDQFPPTFRDDQRSERASAQAITHLRNPDRIDTLGQRALKVLGSWRLVGEVWALLAQTASTDDNREAVRRGDVPWDVFDDAVEAVKNGKRAAPGPLAKVIADPLAGRQWVSRPGVA